MIKGDKRNFIYKYSLDRLDLEKYTNMRKRAKNITI
jgi:hypothetical protein